MKYILLVLIILNGCSTQEVDNEPCEIYEERPFITREYFRYPMEGYIEKTTFEMVCVK